MNWLEYLAQQSAGEGSAPQAIEGVASDAAPTGGSAPASTSPPFDWSILLMFGGVFVFMYFFIMRPQRQEEKRKKEMLSLMKKGDQVVTSSGIIGSIANVKDDTVVLNVGDSTRVEFLKSAISSIREKSVKK